MAESAVETVHINMSVPLSHVSREVEKLRRVGHSSLGWNLSRVAGADLTRLESQSRCSSMGRI
jgi:hypothetical protein